MHRTISFWRFCVWGSLLALLGSGLAQAQIQQDIGGRSSALIVPIGGTVRLQMKTKKPIKTVTNPKDNTINIRTVVGDPTTVLITGQQPDVTQIELIDIDDKKETYEVIVQLDVEYLKTQIRRAVPTANVTPIPSSNNAIILTGTVARAEDIDTILRIAQSLGGVQVINAMRVGGVQQVQLDVVVAAVDRSLTRNVGFDWSVNSKNAFFGSYVAGVQGIPGTIGTAGTLSSNLDPATGAINGLTGSSTAAATFLFGVLHSGWNFLGFLEALKVEGIAKILAQPSLVTLSGRPATFLVGGDQAVPVVGGIGGATGIQFEPFGTQLTFLPIVLGNGKIHMEISPSISQLDQAFGTVLAGNPVPGRRRSAANTTVQLEPGQTFVIGGLTQHTMSASARRIPFLGELPFFGNFFSFRSTSEDEEELVILVTPHLVDGQDCNQVVKVLPGQETRTADDFELYLEGILEAPRGARQVFHKRNYVPAYKNGPSLEVFPCAGGPPPNAGQIKNRGPDFREDFLDKLPRGSSSCPGNCPTCPLPPSGPTPHAPMPFQGAPVSGSVAGPDPLMNDLASPVPVPR